VRICGMRIPAHMDGFCRGGPTLLVAILACVEEPVCAYECLCVYVACDMHTFLCVCVCVHGFN
jgi:hypothetical protein